MSAASGSCSGGRPALLKDAAAHVLCAGDLRATFLPGLGMLGSSLCHRGVELLRRVEDLDAAAAKGGTAGIPFLHPWANRLAALRYHAAGRDVELDASSPLLHFDEHGLPIHGVPWSRLTWDIVEERADRLTARLEWTGRELLAVFPFHHRVEIAATIRPDELKLETTLSARPNGPVPVSFGFHPYFGLPGMPRSEWQLQLPAMRRLVLDARGIPTGVTDECHGFDAQLGEVDFDNGFALLGEHTAFVLSGGGRRITIEFLAGYRYAQIFAPQDRDYIAIEPMTAPTNALQSGDALPVLPPGGQFQAAFQIRVEG